MIRLPTGAARQPEGRDLAAMMAEASADRPSPEAHEVLRRVFGYPAFRAGQDAIVAAVLAGADVLAVLPTGGGKSMCYQLPALMREGLSVVVSPLIALMRDQVAQLTDLGIEAGALVSTADQAETARVWTAAREGRLKLLYVSPERLMMEATLDRLARLGVSLLAVDEAHCVSQWGHDFRPEYARLGEVRARLGEPQVVALTATADVATRADIVERLFAAAPRVFVAGFDRPNLFLAMRPKATPKKQILDFLDRHGGESGVVYCSTRKEVESLAEALAGSGHRALPYHAGLEAEMRARHQDTFLQEDGVVMVATVAFGMGIDKPDVRFVVHAGLPKSIEAYYQEIGRAGRDGLPAETLTLYGLDDMRLRRLQIEDSTAADEQKRVERRRLDALIALAEAPRCRRQTLLAYFGEASEPCGNCDLCRDGVKSFDATIEAQKILSAIARTGERFGSEHVIAVVLGDDSEAIRRFEHDKLKTFGCGRDRPRAEWRSIVRQLIAGGFIAMDIAGYGRLEVTEAGVAVLKGKARVELRADVLRTTERRGRRAKGAPVALAVDADQHLVTALRRLRTALAKEMQVPAYVIFPDRTLVEIAATRPRSRAALGEVHGMGQRKLDRYGAAILEAVAAEG